MIDRHITNKFLIFLEIGPLNLILYIVQREERWKLHRYRY